MSTENFNEKQSLHVIEDMIHAAKKEQSSASAYYFVLWGIIVILYSLLTYYALITHASWQPTVYTIFAIGGILSFIHSKRQDKTETTKGLFDNLYSYIWIAVATCIGLIWVFAAVMGINNIIPVTLLFYSQASFITGCATRYWPSIAGAVICFLCAIFAFSLKYPQQNLVMAFAVLCVHVIPGLMMKPYYRNKMYAK